MVCGLYVIYYCVWFVCGTMVNGLYVIYYCVWFVCGTMHVNQQSHLYTPELRGIDMVNRDRRMDRFEHGQSDIERE